MEKKQRKSLTGKDEKRIAEKIHQRYGKKIKTADDFDVYYIKYMSGENDSIKGKDFRQKVRERYGKKHPEALNEVRREDRDVAEATITYDIKNQLFIEIRHRGKRIYTQYRGANGRFVKKPNGGDKHERK